MTPSADRTTRVDDAPRETLFAVRAIERDDPAVGLAAQASGGHTSAPATRGGALCARRADGPCVKPRLTRDVGCDEIRSPHLPRIARWHTASRAGRAPTTGDARHSEGNCESYIEDLKRRKGADADQPHRVQYKKLVRS